MSYLATCLTKCGRVFLKENLQPGAALGGGSGGPDPPASNRTTHEIRANP